MTCRTTGIKHTGKNHHLFSITEFIQWKPDSNTGKTSNKMYIFTIQLEKRTVVSDMSISEITLKSIERKLPKLNDVGQAIHKAICSLHLLRTACLTESHVANA